MRYAWLFPVFFFLSLPFAQCQQTSMLVLPGIRVPVLDTAANAQLLRDLNEFLSNKNKPVDSNTLVAPAHALETAALLDEMKDIEKSTNYKNDNFYRCYLNNLIAQQDGLFSIQLSYIGVHDSTSLLRGSFHLLAQKSGGRYYFYSPLEQITKSWKVKKSGNIVFHYKDRINEAQANSYVQVVKKFDEKLGISGRTMEFYCCDNFGEAQELVGVQYKKDYNGIAYNSLSAFHKDKSICVAGSRNNNGFNEVDIHDLWHDRLHSTVAVDQINRPVDEGCAYLYGGSWGISWPAILDTIRHYASIHPDANWLNLYNESFNFSAANQPPLNADFMINALIVKMIEKEKGFPKVMELLCCGKAESGNENYFRALTRITGITKENFNATVQSLIAKAE
ncbi:hypothetical protein [Chitinophaga sp. 212800010-3]|uniref:hypothetical protein n=1 Tax=unclassified Chitinophaga TaxID=2619133 RepID=UPI002DF1A9BB|nr:hypothetical protein [Chitinophaga sp. 212800010-3]